MKHTILFLFIGLCIASCHETDYPTFDDSVIAIYFTQDSVNYSFGVTPLSTTEHVVELPVRIIGASVKEVARNFKIEVVDKRTNAESPLHYTVPEQLTLEKDSVNAVVPVTLKRSALGDTEWTVAFRLLPNDYFNPTAQTEKEISCEAIITFNNVVSKPNWTTWNGSFGWSESNMGPWNPVVYVTFMDFFHRLEETLPATYRALVERYGENLDQKYNTGWGEQDFGGWDWDFNYALQKYVCGPMYEYFQAHPELGVTTFPKPNV